MNFSWSDMPLYPDFIGNLIRNNHISDIFGVNGIGQFVLLSIFLLFSIFYVIVSGVIFYHWYAYGMKNKMIYMAEGLFSLVSFALFWFAFLIISNI